MTKTSGVAVIVGVFSIIGVLVLMVRGGVEIYSFLDEQHEQKVDARARDYDVVLRLESQNRTATNFYKEAEAGKNEDISPETARQWLKDLDYDREQIKKMKEDYTGNSPAGD